MRKYFKYIGLIGICLLSFYYTEKVALFVKNKNPIMQSINEVKDSKYVNYINSTLIDDLYIIPGISGKEVNVNSSFNNMQKNKVFNEELLIFNSIKPEISLEDNKDRIIIRGNSERNSVSLIFEEVNNLSKYMLDKEKTVDVLINEEKYDTSYELINNSNNELVYHNIEKYLNKNKINKNLCYVKNDNIPSLCTNKYLFKPSLIVNHSNLSSIKSKIGSGEIILIQNSLTLSELEILVNQIKYQDLSIIPLSELISE